MQRLSVGVWHSGPVKVEGHRQRGLRWPDTHVPPFLQFRLPQARESYSQVEPVKPYRGRNDTDFMISVLCFGLKGLFKC